MTSSNLKFSKRVAVIYRTRRCDAVERAQKRTRDSGNVEIMRAFVRMRNMLASNAELARKIDALERKYDGQFKLVFTAIKKLMMPPNRPKGGIGFVSAKK